MSFIPENYSTIHKLLSLSNISLFLGQVSLPRSTDFFQKVSLYHELIKFCCAMILGVFVGVLWGQEGGGVVSLVLSCFLFGHPGTPLPQIHTSCPHRTHFQSTSYFDLSIMESETSPVWCQRQRMFRDGSKGEWSSPTVTDWFNITAWTSLTWRTGTLSCVQQNEIDHTRSL